MKSRFIIFILILLVTAQFFVACNNDNGQKNTGIFADADTVSSIKQELEDKENSLLAAESDVFWTPSGSLWHSTYKCSYLSSSKTIYHGSVEEAKLDGKSRACERCGGGSDESIYEKLDKNPIAPGDVFFTEEATVWHFAQDCPMIAEGEKVYHGNRAVAASLGKRDACEECKNSD